VKHGNQILKKVKKKLYKYFIKVNVKQCLIYVFNSVRIAEVYKIGHLPAKKNYYDEFLLKWCNFKFEGILFRSDSRCLTACVGLPDLPPSGPK
jgi:hypothetical protein